MSFLTAYNGIFNVTISNNKFYFKKSITDEDDFIRITIPPGACELESLNNEIKRIIIDQDHYTEVDYPFQIKPLFSTLGFIIEISPQEPIINFAPDDTKRNHLRFHETILYKEDNLSNNKVDNLSFDNIFIHTKIALGMIFKCKRSGIIHNFTMDVDPGYKYIEKFRGGLQCYKMQSKDIISSICFKLKMKTKNSFPSLVKQYHSDYQLEKFKIKDSYKNTEHKYNYMSFSLNKCSKH